MTSKNSPDSDFKKILAFIFLFFIYLSFPILLFAFFLTIMLDISYIITFYYTRDIIDFLITIFFVGLSACLIFVIRFLLRWLRT